MTPNQVDSKQDSKVGKVRVKCGSGAGVVLCKLSLKNGEKRPIFRGIESWEWSSPTFGAIFKVVGGQRQLLWQNGQNDQSVQ
jgi:hypothetical protein